MNHKKTHTKTNKLEDYYTFYFLRVTEKARTN